MEHELLGRMVEPLRRQPAGMGPAPVLVTGKDPTMAQQERKQHLALLAQILARRGPHPHYVASCTASGTQIPFSSPARSNRAKLIASRRFALTHSPRRLGISEGATTSQS
ncbi:hypothetical protein NKH17_32455 [Mesorhizobium sp. M1334]|uniref:hypothetical protein n=1 Tax=Mesorhizobium sp. M1334 TaxID=2957084 RepID=UPI003335E2D5